MNSTRRLAVTFTAALATGCMNVDTPYTYVDLVNDYPTAANVPVVVYQARWQAIAFSTPLLPGASSGPQLTVSASDNTAYAILAPGWDPAGSAPPTRLIVIQSRSGFDVHVGDTLQILVDDRTFAGNCLAGQLLAQSDADAITETVFPDTFAGLRYDAATCTTTPIGDAGTE